MFYLQERDGCLGGSWENFCCTWGAEPLGGAGKSRGAETPLETMVFTGNLQGADDNDITT